VGGAPGSQLEHAEHQHDDCTEEDVEEEHPREHESCVEGDDDADDADVPGSCKRPAAASAFLPEPPTVAELLSAVSSPHFNLVAAGPPAAPAAEAPAAPAASGPSVVAVMHGAPGLTSAPSVPVEEAVAGPAVRAGKSLADPAEWNARHRDLLAKLPAEAQPPSVPHGAPS
jgi:hypothetical protein